MAQRLGPDNAVTMANLFFTLYELRRSADAIAEGEAWLAAGEREPTALFHRALGNAYFARSLWPQAEVQYRAALALEPKTFAAARELVSTLTEDGRAAEAVAFGQAWRAEHPDVLEESFDEAVALARAQAVDEPGAFELEADGPEENPTVHQPHVPPAIFAGEQPL